MRNWILEQVSARCWRRVCVSILVMVATAYFLVMQQRYIQNFFLGPYDLGAVDLDEIQDVSKSRRYFVRVVGSTVTDTGIAETTARRGDRERRVSARYYTLAIGDKFLICSGDSGTRTTFEGELAPLPRRVARLLFDTEDTQARRDRYYPFYLNGESFRAPGYWGIAVLLALGFLFVTAGIPGWRYLLSPSSHPVIKRIQSWGDPSGTAAVASREMSSPRYADNKGSFITDQFLVRSTFFDFNLLRLSDLVWAYKKVTKHSVNFIPTGHSLSVVLVGHGGAIEVQCRESTIDDLLITLAAQHAPWARFGFSAQLKATYDQDPDAFCAEVEQRRREGTWRSASSPASRADSRPSDTDFPALWGAYAALELPPGSSLEAVEVAYHSLMRRYDPTKHDQPAKKQAAVELCQKLTDSYNLLKNRPMG